MATNQGVHRSRDPILEKWWASSSRPGDAVVRRKMVTEADLLAIEGRTPGGQWYVHNGFLGWAYGSPLDPTPITRECARRVLDWMLENRYPDALERMQRFPNALDYADEKDELFHRTHGNRLIAFVTPDTCVFEHKQKREEDFQI